MATADNTKNTKARTYISWLTIAFMMVAAVASIRSLPAMAVYGLGSIMLFLIPAIVFFVPVNIEKVLFVFLTAIPLQVLSASVHVLCIPAAISGRIKLSLRSTLIMYSITRTYLEYQCWPYHCLKFP